MMHFPRDLPQVQPPPGEGIFSLSLSLKKVETYVIRYMSDGLMLGVGTSLNRCIIRVQEKHRRMVRDKFLHQVRTDKACTEEGKKVSFCPGRDIFRFQRCVLICYRPVVNNDLYEYVDRMANQL